MGVPAFAQTAAPTPSASPQATAAPSAPPATDIRGVVRDDSDNIVAGARVEVKGPVDEVATTDATGSYDLKVPPGIYDVIVSKRGYETAAQSSMNVVGAGLVANVVLVKYVKSKLIEIGHVSTQNAEQSHFNTTPAAVNSITAQTFDDQAQYSLPRILSEIPGVSVTTATGNYWSGLGMANTGWVNPQIRGSFSYESAQLFDGFPLITADATAGFNAGLFPLVGMSNIDVIKGPGADSPTINSAVGGSINYSSFSPTQKFESYANLGTDGYGGTMTMFRISGTQGRLGYVLGYQAANSPGIFGDGDYDGLWSQGGYDNTWELSFGGQTYLFNAVCSNKSTAAPTPGCQGDYVNKSTPYTSYTYNASWVMCCKTPQSENDNYGVMGKLVYQLTPLGDKRDMTLDFLYGEDTYGYHEGAYRGPTYFGGVFDPAGCGDETSTNLGSSSCNIAAGSTINAPWFSNGDSFLHNYQDELEANFNGNIGPGHLRVGFLSLYQDNTWYSPNQGPALQEQVWGSIPLTPVSSNGTLPPILVSVPSGLACPTAAQLPAKNAASGAQCYYFNGQTVTFQQLGSYNQTEFEKILDFLGDYDLQTGNNSLTDLSFVQSSAAPDTGNDNSINGVYGEAALQQPETHYGMPKQTNDELRLAETLRPSDRFTASASLYYNRYDNYLTNETAPLETDTTTDTKVGTNSFGTDTTITYPTAAQIAAYEASYTNNVNYYMAPRFATSYLLTPNVSLRASAGGALVPIPVLSLATGNGQISTLNPDDYYTESLAPVDLKPETSFGYDIGADIRIPKDAITIKTDAYLTNMHNQFLRREELDGSYDGYPLYVSQLFNLPQSRYEGVELAVSRDVPRGWGFIVQGYLERGYAYNLPANFWSNPITGAPYYQNLTIIPGENFDNGGATGNSYSYVGPAFGIVPYSGGYGEISYRFGPNDSMVRFGATYYGKYNTYFAPAFLLFSTSARWGLSQHVALEASIDNLTNRFSSPWSGGYAAQTAAVAGVPVPQINGGETFAPYIPVGPELFTVRLIFR